jgi:hypothetical protein
MTRLWHFFRSWLQSFHASRRANREAARISKEIHEHLWQDVRRKLLTSNDAALRDYITTRAAQIAQPHVDRMMKNDGTLSGSFGSDVLFRTSKRSLASTIRQIKRVKIEAA